jgi:light-regulated signal transduction histidine kinase (bacteriophytochrome)/CheY-like chemotaxis protein
MHLKYLHNMGVRSSMSIAIVVNDCLWGLYALHSYTAPTKPTVEQRIMLEMVGSISAMRVDFFERDRTSKRKLDLTQCMRHMNTTNSLTEFLNTHFRSIINILDAHAIVVYENSTDGGRMIFGDTTIAPTQEGIQTLTAKAKPNTLFSLSNFSDGLEGLGAGVIFFKHSTASLALIRRSRISDVKWGGTPDKVYDPKIPDRLTPRVSFSTYLESSRKEAKLWTPVDLELADLFFERTTQYLHDQMLATFRLSLDQSNAECIQAIESAQEHYEFFAHMSHELRTPFHGVISSLQILNCDQVHEPERDDIIESALDCGKSMLRTLDDILTIAKSRTGTEVSRSPLAMSKLISRTQRMMMPIAENKSVVLSIEEGVKILEGNGDQMHLGEINWPTLAILADETHIGQVTSNLTSNAIKFTSSGGKVTIRVHISSQKDMVQFWKNESGRFENAFVPTMSDADIDAMAMKNDEPWCIYEVEDTGCGVSGDDMKVMFNAYKQVSSGVTKTYQGTGLGLHICRTHASLMNGMLGVASTRGKGSIFFFAIPVGICSSEESLKAIADEPPVPPVQEKPKDSEEIFSMSADEISTLSVKDSLFLIVDDSTVNLRLTKRKIQLALGDEIGIKTAVDGLEAIAFYEDMLKQGTNTNLTGIFMDYHMPRCSGLEAMEVIRRMEQEHSVTQPVHMIAFTADLSETTTQKLRSAGANDVMAKPTPTGEIENACAELIRKKQKAP